WARRHGASAVAIRPSDVSPGGLVREPDEDCVLVGMVGTKRTGHPHYTSSRGIENERQRANSVTAIRRTRRIGADQANLVRHWFRHLDLRPTRVIRLSGPNGRLPLPDP